jgi:hypothetical protein
MIGVNPARAFNRDRQREDILSALEKLFGLNTTALILDEASSNTHHAERERHAHRIDANEERIEAGYIRHRGAVLCGVPDQSKTSVHHCGAFFERAGEPELLDFQER